jgi:hypothetical protein
MRCGITHFCCCINVLLGAAGPEGVAGKRLLHETHELLYVIAVAENIWRLLSEVLHEAAKKGGGIESVISTRIRAF